MNVYEVRASEDGYIHVGYIEARDHQEAYYSWRRCFKNSKIESITLIATEVV